MKPYAANTIAIYYAENIAAGANTVHVSVSNSTSLRFAILEYAGLATSGSLDLIATGQGDSTTPKSGSVSPSTSGEFALGIIMTARPRNLYGRNRIQGEELVPAAPNAKMVVEDLIRSASESVAASATLGAANNWAAGMATFKGASSGSGTTTAGNLSATPGSAVSRLFRSERPTRKRSN